jgi:hypothetical protein
MKRGSRVNPPTQALPETAGQKQADNSGPWGNVAPVRTALMQNWIRRRLMDSRIAGQLTLDALRDLFASREDRP